MSAEMNRKLDQMRPKSINVFSREDVDDLNRRIMEAEQALHKEVEAHKKTKAEAEAKLLRKEVKRLQHHNDQMTQAATNPGDPGTSSSSLERTPPPASTPRTRSQRTRDMAKSIL